MGKKKCWIIRNAATIGVHTGKVRLDGEFWTHGKVIGVDNLICPLLRKMWRKVLIGKRGKAAIAEVDWETWVPYVDEDFICASCLGRVRSINDSSCTECTGMSKVTRLMTKDDLK